MKINWSPDLWGTVAETKDFFLLFVERLQFNTPVQGKPGYRLVYRHTDVVQAEGVNIAQAVIELVESQRQLDSIKNDEDYLESIS